MEKFFAKLKSDAEFKSEFFDFMHSKESQFAQTLDIIKTNFNNQVQDAIREFADLKGMTLEDSELVKEALAEKCKNVAKKIDEAILAEFYKK